MHYPIGKLPQAELIRLLDQKLSNTDPRVILGPGLGRDAAVIDFGDRYLVAKTDPITFATDEIGWYAVNVNANDVACLGARPAWFIATLLLPEHRTDRALAERIFEQIHSASGAIGVTVVGGHTEITYGIDRPIVVGAMFGEVQPDHLIRSDGARPGDAVILTKGIAVEGTAILALEKGETLLRRGVAAAVIERARRFLHDPGISVVRDAQLIASLGRVHAMHDPTEGGVATGIYEMIEAAGMGAELDKQALSVLPETALLCQALGLEPWGLIASGALLASVEAEDATQIIRGLRAEGIAAAVIGAVRETPGVVVRGDGVEAPLPRFARDEIARMFGAGNGVGA